MSDTRGHVERGEVGVGADAGQRVVGGRAEELEDEIELVVDLGAGKERLAADHLVEDAADAPHVDVRRVVGGAEEHVGRPVPQSDHLVRVGLGGYGLGARQPEVGELELAARIDEQVLRLEVAVQYLLGVAVGEAAQQLEEEQAYVAHAHDVGAVVHVLLEVALEVLEDERERLVRVDDVVQRDDVGVLELLEQRDLAYRRARRALLVLETDLFERHKRAVYCTLALVHGRIRALQ